MIRKSRKRFSEKIMIKCKKVVGARFNRYESDSSRLWAGQRRGSDRVSRPMPIAAGGFRRVRGFAISLLLAMSAVPAGAADVKVISAGAVRGLIAGIIADYSRQTGHKFDFKVGTTGQLRGIIASGEPADLIIASAMLMAELEQSGKMMAGSRADLGRVGIGVAIREGASVPDLATPEAFKQSLLAARSVTYTDPREGGTSGIYVMGVLERFGIGEIVARKAVLSKGGRDAVERVARGEAEMAVTLISEIVPVTGARLAAAVPQSLQQYTVYAAAIPASSTDPAAARAFIAALTRPAMAERWRLAGFEPPN
jgi:molybdate transport system substrate-binding protein